MATNSLRATAIAFAVIPLLSACGASGGGKVQSASASVSQAKPRQPGARRPVRRPPPAAVVQHIPGLESVIGSTAAQLTQQFGTPRLDVWEGDARKLQFTGNACILDVFLYPPAEGREPQATYTDARQPDGRDMDEVACTNALKKR